MPRTLEIEQNALVASSGLSIITLVKLTTFTDVKDKTGAFVFFISDKPVTYDYDNEGTDRQFWPILATFTPLTRGMTHAPLKQDVAPYSGGLVIKLVNQIFDGRRVHAILKEKNLLGAEIEVSEIAVGALTPRNDLTAKTGTEHTRLFRGVVLRVGNIKDSLFDLDCRVTIPPIAAKWIYGNDEGVDPLDKGKRLPIVYGDSRRVPCVGTTVGAYTSLTVTMDNSTDNFAIGVADTFGFPASGNYKVRVEQEIMLVNTLNDTQLFVVTGGRAQDFTTATSHAIGSGVAERLANYTWSCAGHEVSSIDTLWVENPLDAKIYKVDTAFTKDTRNTDEIAGEVVSTVSFSSNQLSLLIDELEIAAGGTASAQTNTEKVFFNDSNEGTVFAPGGFGFIKGSFANGKNLPDYQAVRVGAPATTEGFQVWAENTVLSTRFVKQWRIVIIWSLKQHPVTDVDWHFPHDFFGVNALETIQEVNGSAEKTGTQTGPWHILTPGAKQLSDIERSTAPTAGTDENFCASFLHARTDTVTSTDFWRMLINSDSYVECDLEELEVLRPKSIQPAAVGNGLRFYADVKGYKAPGDSIDPSAAVTVVDSMDAAAGTWGKTGCTLANEATIKREGTGSLKLTTTADNQWTASLNTLSSLDWTSTAVIFWVNIPLATLDAIKANGQTNDLQIWVSSDSTFITDVFKYNISPYDIEPDTWTKIHISTDDLEDDSLGTLDKTDVDAIAIYFRQDAATAGRIVYVDDVHTVPSERIYSVVQHALLEHPVDILTHWIEEIGDERVDRTQRSASVTNLGSNKIGGDIRALGLDWATIAQGIAFAARANVIPDDSADGRFWKILTADANYKWPVPTVHLKDFLTFDDQRRSVEELATHFSFRYNFDASLRGVGEEAYKSVGVANPSLSDVSVTAATLDAAERAFGAQELSPFFFRMIRNKDTAEEVAGYLVHEWSDHDRAVYVVGGITWMDGYKLEVGDIIAVTPPDQKVDEQRVFGFNTDAANWTPSNATLSDDATTQVEGIHSLKVQDDNTNILKAATREVTPRLNLRDKAVSFWFRVNATLLANPINTVFLLVGSETGLSSNWKQFNRSVDQIVAADVWYQFFVPIDPDNEPGPSNGTLEPERTLVWRFGYISGGPNAGNVGNFDDARITSRRIPARIISWQKSFANQHTDITAVEVVTV